MANTQLMCAINFLIFIGYVATCSHYRECYWISTFKFLYKFLSINAFWTNCSSLTLYSVLAGANIQLMFAINSECPTWVVSLRPTNMRLCFTWCVAL